jgi:accessory gene regulator protein AgrB
MIYDLVLAKDTIIFPLGPLFAFLPFYNGFCPFVPKKKRKRKKKHYIINLLFLIG